jgi:hypothetical protein
MLGAMAKAASKPSAVIDTRVIYCGDNLEQLRKLPDACVDLIYIDRPAVQFEPQLRSFLGRDERETRLRRSTCINAGLHRVHAPALREVAPRIEEEWQLLPSRRLAREPPCESYAGSGFRRQSIPQAATKMTLRSMPWRLIDCHLGLASSDSQHE